MRCTAILSEDGTRNWSRSRPKADLERVFGMYTWFHALPTRRMTCPIGSIRPETMERIRHPRETGSRSRKAASKGSERRNDQCITRNMVDTVRCPFRRTTT